MTVRLKPALILGSGFHRHVFGERASPNQREVLWDWHALIDATAGQMQVATPSRQQAPVLRWETLIGRALEEGFRAPDGHWQLPGLLQAHQVEALAKVHLAKNLQTASIDYPNSTRARIPLDPRWGCVISLNFDHAWNPALRAKSLHLHRDSGPQKSSASMMRRDLVRIHASVAPAHTEQTRASARLWFPNGSVLRPKTIRMGLHDYGEAPASIQTAFRRLKSWERALLGTTSPRSKAGFDTIAYALRAASEGEDNLSALMDQPAIPLSWVAELMYRPLYFAGVGLSEQETGLWWLLAQRARNLARVESESNSQVRILIRRNDCMAFWATRPFGVEPVVCDDWDDGWQRLMSETAAQPNS